MRFKPKEDPGEWRKAVLFSQLGFAILASLLFWRHVIPRTVWLAILSAVVVVAATALFRPRWFRGYYRVLGKVSGFMSEWIGRVLLTVVFILLVVPLGLVLRALGKDPLRLKRPVNAQTHWQTARECTPLDRPY